MQQTQLMERAKRSGGPILAVMERGQELDLPLRLLGQSQAPIISQRVGQWWLQPLTSETVLPARAEHRLETLLAAGVKPKAVAVFHEIPAVLKPPTLWDRRVARLIHWTQQELPGALERFGRTAMVHGPTVGRVLFRASTLTAAGIALVTWKVVTVLAVAAVTDPCLVIVTEDGYWVEVDRWYS